MRNSVQRLVGIPLHPRDAADRVERDVVDADPEGAGDERMPQLVEDDAAEEKNHQEGAEEGAGRSVRDPPLEGADQEDESEGDVHPDFDAGDPGHAEGGRHRRRAPRRKDLTVPGIGGMQRNHRAEFCNVQ